jgi:hypothetical protein
MEIKEEAELRGAAFGAIDPTRSQVYLLWRGASILEGG